MMTGRRTMEGLAYENDDGLFSLLIQAYPSFYIRSASKLVPLKIRLRFDGGSTLGSSRDPSHLEPI